MAECAEKAIIHKKHAGLIAVQKAAFLTQNLIPSGKFQVSTRECSGISKRREGAFRPGRLC